MAAIGEPFSRVDGRAKVTGGARYTAEFHVPNVVHAVMILSTVPSGSVAAIDTSDARRQPGVLTVLTHENAPRVSAHKIAAGGPTDRHLAILQDAEVRHDRQPVAVVVADTFERATHAASLVSVRYARERAVKAFELADAYTPNNLHREPSVVVRGTPEASPRGCGKAHRPHVFDARRTS